MLRARDIPSSFKSARNGLRLPPTRQTCGGRPGALWPPRRLFMTGIKVWLILSQRGCAIARAALIMRLDHAFLTRCTVTKGVPLLRGVSTLRAADHDASRFLDRLDRFGEIRLRALIADHDFPESS